jgi:hypothetical protein
MVCGVLGRFISGLGRLGRSYPIVETLSFPLLPFDNV